MRKRQIIFSYVVIFMAILACTLPNRQNTPQPDLAATITAQALLIQTGGQSPQPGAPTQITNTPLPEAAPTITLTPTPTIPIVSVSQNTNCRTGPGTIYDQISALLIGETAEVVGKNTEFNYWIIKNPDGSGTCWLWGKYATVSGNISALPEIAAPPTPTPSLTPTLAPPAPPKNLTANKACVPLAPPLFQYLGTITWEDDANNEDGYNVYMNGALLVVLPPNTKVAPLPGLPFPAGTPMTMGVEAFNAAGKSAMKTVVIICP